jgi:hypothetical protein
VLMIAGDELLTVVPLADNQRRSKAKGAHMRLVPSAIAAVVLMTGASSIATADYVATGAGVLSCGRWTLARDQHQAVGFEQWVLGFLSGVGFMGGRGTNPLQGTNADGVLYWFDGYCKERSLKPIADAAAEFVAAHSR